MTVQVGLTVIALHVHFVAKEGKVTCSHVASADEQSAEVVLQHGGGSVPGKKDKRAVMQDVMKIKVQFCC